MIRAEVERAANGLRVAGHALYLEPRGRPPLGFLAHARGARPVLPERAVATAATVKLLEAAQPRALRRTAALPAAYGQRFSLGSLELTLHPAGHVLGSAQLRCEADGLDLLYAGDIGGKGPTASLTAEPREDPEADVLALRALYGHPRYVFPPREQALEQAGAFVDRCKRDGKTPVLVAVALGAAQDLVKWLGDRGLVLRLHPTAHRACEAYAAQGISLKNFVELGEPGDAVLVPPTARIDRLKLGPHRTCAFSGRALAEKEIFFSGGAGEVDEAVALSDHAGFDELLDFALRSHARRVLCIDGHADDLARELRRRGVEALVVREHHQLSLPGF
ncbi:MAG TPA: MBL fold metallo-hydrolase [Myxococcales bacterium]|nr:MBL fold metallo-hydrolase [Myxococcales bacterium]